MDENTLILFPAYGRQYDDFAKAVEDWQNGKDFSINGFRGPYCSIRDIEILQKRYTKVFLANSTLDLQRII